MANNEYVNRVDYGDDTLIDISDTTAEAGDVLQGETFYLRSGAPATGTLGDATQSTHGLMSAADKVKLDSIEAGAQNWDFDSVVDRAPYIMRKSGGDVNSYNQEKDKLVGGTIVWNQLAPETSDKTKWYPNKNTLSNDENILVCTITEASQSASISPAGSAQVPTFPAGHKVLYKIEAFCEKTTIIRAFYSAVADPKDLQLTANTWGVLTGITAIKAATTLAVYMNISNYLSVSDVVKFKNIYAIDLTQMFGSTIADYIYSLETANVGAGVAWFRKLFPKDYYIYDEGSLQSVQATSHITRGFNAWDEEWEVGAYNTSNGQKATDGNSIRCKNKIPVVPGASYYFKNDSNYYLVFGYDADGNFIRYMGARISTSPPFTIPNDTYYITFYNYQYGNTYAGGIICFNLHGDGERDGEYEPYNKHIYALDDNLVLRGIPKLDSNNKLYYDGDMYEADGTVTRRYGIIDLSELASSMTYDSGYGCWKVGLTEKAYFPGNNVKANVIDSTGRLATNFYDGHKDQNKVAVQNNGNLLVGNNSSTTKPTTGIIVYELATPTTETAEPFQNPQLVDNYGTEEYVDYGVATGIRDVAIPVGHETQYASADSMTIVNNLYLPCATTSAPGQMSASDKVKLDGITTMVGATSLAAGTSGLVPAPTTSNPNNYLRGDGTWNQPVVILTYGVSTYSDFEDAFNRGAMIFCRATRDTSDSTITDYTRYATLSYVNPPSQNNPFVTFVYYRRSGISSTNYCDETYEYTLSSPDVWRTSHQRCGIKQITTSGDGLSVDFNTGNAIVTLTTSAFTGATSSTAGTGGLVPAPTAADSTKFLCGDGTWATISGSGTPASVFTGATSQAAGTSGLVPAPTTSDTAKFLRGDGTWADNTYVNVTSTTAGLMTATDKVKLDSIEEINPYNTITTSAPIVHLTDAAEAPIKEMEIEINPVQDFNGYDHPWTGGSQKNLFPQASHTLNHNINRYEYSVVLPQNTYTFSATVSCSDPNASIYVTIYNSDRSGWLNTNINSNHTYVEATINNSTISAIKFNCVSELETFTCTFSNIQLEAGSTATDYEPYENICPISGWDTINIYNTKFNCYPEEWISDGYGLTSTGDLTAGNNHTVIRTDFFPVKAGITYYYNFPEITASGEYYNNIFWYDHNYTFISAEHGKSSFAVTAPSNAMYAKLSTTSIYNSSSGIYNNDICLNVYDETRNGAYVPYQQGHEYEISLPQTIYGGKLTVYGNGSGELSINKKFYHLTANDTIGLGQQQVSGFNRFFFYTDYGVKYKSTKYLACDKLPRVTSANPGIGIIGIDAANIGILSDLSTVEAFKEWLTEIGGLDIVYESNPLITYQLASSQVQTFLSENNIWANSGNINKIIYCKNNINGLISGVDKVKLDCLKLSSSLLGIKLATTILTPVNGVVTIPTMTGCSASAAGATGIVPAPVMGDENKFLAGDGTWKAGGLPMVILSYGNSTWDDFINAYNNNVIVYCRASSSSDPASGSQTRMAFMAYVNNGTTPTEVEFQYYRSVPSHSSSQMGDQVFIYKLNKTSGWSVTTREASLKQIQIGSGDAASVSYSSNKITLKGGLPAVTAADNGKILQVVNGVWTAVTPS